MMFQFKLKSFYNRGESYKSLGKEKKRRKTDKYTELLKTKMKMSHSENLYVLLKDYLINYSSLIQ